MWHQVFWSLHRQLFPAPLEPTHNNIPWSGWSCWLLCCSELKAVFCNGFVRIFKKRQVQHWIRWAKVLYAWETSCYEPLPGRKKLKGTVTVLIFSTSNVSEMFEATFIGDAVRPRAFKKVGQSFSWIIFTGTRAWIESDLFFKCLQWFNPYISSTPGRNSILSIDKPSTHCNNDNISYMSKFKVVIFLSNTRSII